MKIYVVLWHCRSSCECLGVFSEHEDAIRHLDEVNENSPSGGYGYIATRTINNCYSIPACYL